MGIYSVFFFLALFDFWHFFLMKFDWLHLFNLVFVVLFFARIGYSAKLLNLSRLA